MAVILPYEPQSVVSAQRMVFAYDQLKFDCLVLKGDYPEAAEVTQLIQLLLGRKDIPVIAHQTPPAMKHLPAEMTQPFEEEVRRRFPYHAHTGDVTVGGFRAPNLGIDVRTHCAG